MCLFSHFNTRPLEDKENRLSSSRKRGAFMNLKTLSRGKDWMTAKECAVTGAFVAEMDATFEAGAVVVTPLMVLRTEDVLVSHLMVQRIEQDLAEDGDPDMDPKEQRARPLALIEAAGKARERLRKAMKELEDACTKAGTPIDTGLADRMRPLLQQTEGTIEDALRFAEEKREREAPAASPQGMP
jgi:hypothetical protein